MIGSRARCLRPAPSEPTSSTWPRPCTATPWRCNWTARRAGPRACSRPSSAGPTTCNCGTSGKRSTAMRPTRRMPRTRGYFSSGIAPTMEAGAKCLWPDEEDLYMLMRMRVEGGRTAFEREKQGSPLNPDLCEWPEAYFGDDMWFDQWPAEYQVRIVALDPSQGRDTRRSDLLGLRHVVHRPARRAACRRRPGSPHRLARSWPLARRFAARFEPDAFGVETNQFQQLLAGQFEEEFLRQGIVGVQPWSIDNRVNKLVRIRRLGPYLSTRRMRFKSNSPGTRSAGRATAGVSRRRPRRRTRRAGDGHSPGRRTVGSDGGRRWAGRPACHSASLTHAIPTRLTGAQTDGRHATRQQPSARNHSAISEQLERRLSEAWQSLWDNFVDPRESLWDDGGRLDAARRRVHAGTSSTGTAPFVNETQLRDIREQCRLLAVANEFAINGHENRISYLVGRGTPTERRCKKGRNASPELAAARPGSARRVRLRKRLARAGSRRSSAAGIATAKSFCGSSSRSDGRRACGSSSRGRWPRPPSWPIRSGGQLRHPHRAGRRGNAAGLLRRRQAGRRGRDSASQGQRRRQRQARPAVVLSGAQEPAPGGKAAAQHERRGRDSVGHRPDSQASRRHRERRAAIRRRPGRRQRHAAGHRPDDQLSPLWPGHDSRQPRRHRIRLSRRGARRGQLCHGACRPSCGRSPAGW